MQLLMVFFRMLMIGSFVSQDVGVGVVSEYKRKVTFHGSHFILLSRRLDLGNVNKTRKAKEQSNRWLRPILRPSSLRLLLRPTNNVPFAWRFSRSKKWVYLPAVNTHFVWHVSWSGRK